MSAQLQSQSQALLRRAKEKLRCVQVSLQETLGYEEALQSSRLWLSSVTERLHLLSSTTGSKEALESRLAAVQVRTPSLELLKLKLYNVLFMFYMKVVHLNLKCHFRKYNEIRKINPFSRRAVIIYIQL